MKQYFVYAHVTKNGQVFYVGKGSGNRDKQFGNRSQYWKRIRNKYGCVVVMLEKGLTEDEAFSREIHWISHYKQLDQCRANLTNGGDGVRVVKRWWNEAISASLKGMMRPRGAESKSFKPFCDKATLLRLYETEGMTSIKIAEMFSVSYATVCSRLSQFGIKVRRAGREAMPVRCLEDGKRFLSITQAAAFYGLHRENIGKLLSGTYKTTGKRKFVYDKE